MTSAFKTLTIGQGHTTRSKVTDVEVSAFSEWFLFYFFLDETEYPLYAECTANKDCPSGAKCVDGVCECGKDLKVHKGMCSK